MEETDDEKQELVYENEIYIRESNNIYNVGEDTAHTLIIETNSIGTLDIRHEFYEKNGDDTPLSKSSIHTIPNTLAIKLRNCLNLLYPENKKD